MVASLCERSCAWYAKKDLTFKLTSASPLPWTRKERTDMSRLVSLFSILLLAGAVSCGSGDKKLELGGACSLNSDCADGLLCKFGACHKACMKSVDCATGERCVQVDGTAVCQTTTEVGCKTNGSSGSCPAPLTCRVADNTCRNQCTGTDACLPGQTCSGTVCVETKELTPVPGLDGGASVDVGDVGSDASSASPEVVATVPDAGTADVVDVVWDAPATRSEVPDAALDAGQVTIADVGTSALDGPRPLDSEGALSACSGSPRTITYDCSVTPDAPPWNTVFSSQMDTGASWSASNGELQMTTAPGAGIWFGNHRTYQTPAWMPAPLDQGNTLSLRARLGADSERWYTYLFDGGSTSTQIVFMKGFVTLYTDAGVTRYDVDTSATHTYVMATGPGWRSYSIDGVEVLRARSTVSGSIGRTELLVGDGKSTPGADGNETGTFFLDEVVIKTYTACMP